MAKTPSKTAAVRSAGKSAGKSAGSSANSPAGERARKIQRQQDEHDGRAQAKGEQAADAKKQPVQAGAREQPAKMPAQHLAKPGLEKDLALKPQYQAPGYEGSNKLRGMAALITGGDSGIGRAVAVLYAREGADVGIVYLPDEQPDAEETRSLVEAEGTRCELIPGDVKDGEFCRRAVEQVVQAFGRLDVLVNNAAFQEHAASLEDLDDERILETLHTNILGYMHMAKAALPHLKQGSAIVNTGSVTGLEGSAKLLDYSATKGAIHAFTKSLASNLLPKGIRVNAVAPGPVWTPLNPADSPPEQVAKFGESTDMKRPAQPEELSPAYVFLAAPVCSGYITGIILPVTGSVGAE
jgi:NAD(P)-dependent dehydrogenase (short-subunit alcohol dehydrogenase family)